MTGGTRSLIVIFRYAEILPLRFAQGQYQRFSMVYIAEIKKRRAEFARRSQGQRTNALLPGEVEEVVDVQRLRRRVVINVHEP